MGTEMRSIALRAFLLITLVLLALLALGLRFFVAAAEQGGDPLAAISNGTFTLYSPLPTLIPTPRPPTATPWPTATPIPTKQPPPTFTPTATPRPTRTSTPTPTATATPYPTAWPTPTPTPTFWIDVDLSEQKLYAYRGNKLLKEFTVSTGKWNTPTPVGQFRVWIKLLYDDMEGPGYFYPKVPYVLYFYQGYGSHGTYWGTPIGKPASAGCVIMRTEDAAWVYEHAEVGTLINIHP